MENKIKTIILENHGLGIVSASVREIKDSLDEFYSIINCRTIDIIERKLADDYYDFIVDDEFLFSIKDGDLPTLSCSNADETLWGNIIITSHDDEGNTISLKDRDIIKIMQHFNSGNLYYEI